MGKRDYCTICKRALSACYCKALQPVENQSSIIILQHPSEKHHPLGTARMAKLSLSNIQLFVGEDFTNHTELNKILENSNSILIFKKNNSLDFQKAEIQKTDNPVYIFLDGTWNKAKKIFYSSQNLHKLPCFHFNAQKTSKYIHRKAPKEEHLSTFESIVHILNQVEKNDYSDCLSVLDFVMEFQSEKMRKKH